MDRTASISRTTSETDIAVTLNLDGSGRSDIDKGIGFFDHILRSFAKHWMIKRESADMVLLRCRWMRHLF